METTIWIKDDSKNGEMDKMRKAYYPLIDFKWWITKNENSGEYKVLIRHPEKLKFEKKSKRYKYSEVKKLHLDCIKKYFPMYLKEMYIGE